MWVESRAAEPRRTARHRAAADDGPRDRRQPRRRYGDVRRGRLPRGNRATSSSAAGTVRYRGRSADHSDDGGHPPSASTVAGRTGLRADRTGKIKPYIITGAVLLTVGFAGLGTLDSGTPILPLSAEMLCVGMGVGMTLQNLVLVVQNTCR
ncbi:hypothetical protein ACRAWF_27140 [Streptomyces sp. L7]